MELLKNLATKQKQIVVSEKLVEIGDDTWQIKNLTGVSTRESKITLDVPEPVFSEPKPQGKIQFSIVISFVVAGFLIASYSNKEWWAWAGIILGVLSIWDNKKDEKIYGKGNIIIIVINIEFGAN